MVEPVGTCYEDAWRFLIKEEEGELIHGTVESLGQRRGHAWVKLPTGYIWEPQTKSYFSIKDFDIAASPIEEHRYTVEEAAIMVARAGKHGPWAEEEKEQFLKRGILKHSNPEAVPEVTANLKALSKFATRENMWVSGSYALGTATAKSDLDMLVGVPDDVFNEPMGFGLKDIEDNIWEIIPKADVFFYNLSDKNKVMQIPAFTKPGGIVEKSIVKGLWKDARPMREVIAPNPPAFEPKRYIIKQEPEPLYRSGKKYVAYYEDGTPRYLAAETEQALKDRLLEAEPSAEFVKPPAVEAVSEVTLEIKEIQRTPWFRGAVSKELGGDTFWSASESVAGDYGTAEVGQKATVRKISAEEIPQNPYIVKGSKEELASELGIELDPYTQGWRFDAKAKEILQGRGYDAIFYPEGTLGAEELHIFEKPPAVEAVPEVTEISARLATIKLPNIKVTGSYAIGKATPRSDIDLLVGVPDAEWAKVTLYNPPSAVTELYNILPESKMSIHLYKLSDPNELWHFQKPRVEEGKHLSGAFVPVDYSQEMVQGLWDKAVKPTLIPNPAVEAVPEVEYKVIGRMASGEANLLQTPEGYLVERIATGKQRGWWKVIVGKTEYVGKTPERAIEIAQSRGAIPKAMPAVEVKPPAVEEVKLGGGNPVEEVITKEEAIGLLERLSATPLEAARLLVVDEAERRAIWKGIQERVKREQNKFAPFDPREGPPIPRIFAGLRWPWR